MEERIGSASNHHLLSKLFGQYDSQSRFSASSVATKTRKTGLSTCLLVFVLSVFAAAVSAKILINEVDVDQQGTDNAEFVELFDGGDGNTDLSSLVLVFFNGNKDTVYRAFNLDGFETNEAGYFVLCGDNQNVEHCDNDVSPDRNLIQNGADAVALYNGDKANFPTGTTLPTTNPIDAIVYDTDEPDDPGLLPLLMDNQPQINEGNSRTATKHSNQRCPNGSGGKRETATYAQFPPTPGTKNVCGNAAPTTVGNIPPKTLTIGETYTLDVSQYFSDPNDTLTYTATSSDPDIVSITISNGIMKMIRK